MKVLLDGLLPRLFPSLHFYCVSHEGKQDLEKSVPRKLRAWKEPGVRFVVIRDNDGGDCRALKSKLTALCLKGRHDHVLVRIACQELEAWYLGDPDALAEAYGREALRGLVRKAGFRDVDAIPRPAAALERLVPEFQKVSGARLMARFLSEERNRSTSFKALLTGINRLCAEASEAEPG